MEEIEVLVDKLEKNKNLTDEEFAELVFSNYDEDYLFKKADFVRRSVYEDKVYIRGLIEFTNYCKNDCFYCGIRKSNNNAQRYRLTKEEILQCCEEGYKLGFRTFVLQGGEDGYFSDDVICGIVDSIKNKYSDCAVTLSIGEKSRSSYKSYFDAGANRYLLRHETAENSHYERLHPKCMSLEKRKECLFNLRDIGYQVGSGFMVGSPFQTAENIIADLRFLNDLKPDMIGIGPYITHKDTPFKNFKSGDAKTTLRLISVLRLMFPHALIPSTTALGTIHHMGRERGLKVGANIVMPNLSPTSVRKLYSLYENKICTGEEAAQGINKLKESVKEIGYNIVTDRGDVKR